MTSAVNLIQGQQITAKPKYFAPNVLWIHTHRVYSNNESGDTIRFRLYDKRTGDWYQFDEYLVFRSDMIVADAINPFRLEKAKKLTSPAEGLEPFIDIFPNPVTGRATIRYASFSRQTVIFDIYDSKGRIVGSIEPGPESEGLQVFHWTPVGLAKGSYVIVVQGNRMVQKSIVIL